MDDKKQILLEKLAVVVKELRGQKSQFMLGSENGISTSILSMVERSIKDLQYTTFYRLAEALGVKPHELMKKVEELLPDGFSMIDD